MQRMKSIDRATLLVRPGHRVHLQRIDTAATGPFSTKADAHAQRRHDRRRLSDAQERLYADKRYALLIILQGMDTAGKDGAIRHVTKGVSPQGIDVHAFAEPSPRELAHDYLWRTTKALPERGRIAIFNRSYYEELTVVRVHADQLANEHLPETPHANLWHERYEDINAFERHLTRNGTIVLKFFLHLSKDEQRKRLLARIDAPEKNWKISAADLRDRDAWDRYQHAYEQLLTATSTACAPWHIIPADHKWFARAAIADAIVDRLEELDLTYPTPSKAQREILDAQRRQLEG